MTENKELSFLDLFVAIIKYRKIVYIPTIVFAFLYGMYLFVAPIIFPSMGKKQVEIVSTVNIEQMSSTLSSYLNLDITTFAEKNLKDVANFSAIQKKYNIWTSVSSNERAYNTEIKTIFNSSAFSVSRETKGIFKITAKVEEAKIESYKDFINEYVQFCSHIVELQVKSLVDSTESNINNMLSKFEEKENSKIDVSSLLSLQLEIKNFRESHETFIMLNGEPFESYIAKGRVKKFSKSVGVAFVFFLILSFVVSLIEKIKEDPEKRKIISDAWKAGK